MDPAIPTGGNRGHREFDSESPLSLRSPVGLLSETRGGRSGNVVIGVGFYLRLLIACLLTIALIWTSTLAVFVLLSAMYPGEDHDFEGGAIYVAFGYLP
jgi:hypothetical protein